MFPISDDGASYAHWEEISYTPTTEYNDGVAGREGISVMRIFTANKELGYKIAEGFAVKIEKVIIYD